MGPDDIHTALLTVAETTDSRSTATGALNVLVETGEISDNVSRFPDTGSPEGKHFFVRPWVYSASLCHRRYNTASPLTMVLFCRSITVC